MKKVHNSAMVIIPPKILWPPIQAIRKQYDRQIQRWMPHINLIYPFVPLSKFNHIIHKIKPVCERIKSFPLTFKEIKYFKHGKQNYTLWLAPQPREKIISVQSKLITIFPRLDDLNRFKGGFTPHLSIGQIKGNTQFKKLLSHLQEKWEPISFTCGEIYFIHRTPQKNSPFQIERIISLSGN